MANAHGCYVPGRGDVMQYSVVVFYNSVSECGPVAAFLIVLYFNE